MPDIYVDLDGDGISIRAGLAQVTADFDECDIILESVEISGLTLYREDLLTAFGQNEIRICEDWIWEEYGWELKEAAWL